MKFIDIFRKLLLEEDEADITDLIPEEVKLASGEINKTSGLTLVPETIMLSEKNPPEKLKYKWEKRLAPFEFGVALRDGDVHDFILALAMISGAKKIAWRIQPTLSQMGRKYAVISMHK